MGSTGRCLTRTTLAVVAAILLAGCAGQRTGGPDTSTSPVPPDPGPSPSAPARPTPQELATVAVTRDPVSQVATTIALAGRSDDIVLDPLAREAYVVTCPGCGQEPFDDAQVIEVLDMATRAPVARIPIPAHSARLAVDPHAGVLYASHTGDRGEQIAVIDTSSRAITRTIEVAAWAIAVDPTTGTLYALTEGPADEQPAAVAVIDPARGVVLRRIEVGADVTSGLAVDPVRGRLLVSDQPTGRLLVVVGGRVDRTIHVVGWLADPCENCLGSISTPIVDPTTGLAYVTGPADRSAEPNPSQARGTHSGTVHPIGLASADARITPAGFGTDTMHVVDPAAGVTQVIGLSVAGAGSHGIDPSAGVVYLAAMDMRAIGDIATGVLPIGIEALTIGATIPVPAGSAGAMHVAVDPTTGAVWVAGEGSVTVLE